MRKLSNRLLAAAILLLPLLGNGVALAGEDRHSMGSETENGAVVNGRSGERHHEKFHEEERHHPHHRFGTLLIVPLVVVPYSSPPLYSMPNGAPEGDSLTPPGETPGHWYYCASAEAYYPTVFGWRQLILSPPEEC